MGDDIFQFPLKNDEDQEKESTAHLLNRKDDGNPHQGAGVKAHKSLFSTKHHPCGKPDPPPDYICQHLMPAEQHLDKTERLWQEALHRGSGLSGGYE